MICVAEFILGASESRRRYRGVRQLVKQDVLSLFGANHTTKSKRDSRSATLAVEKTFFANDRNSALLNVLVDEIVAIDKRKGLRVKLLAANVVRKLICWNGSAAKHDVAQEVCHRFPELTAYLSSDRRWKEDFYLSR